MNVNLSLFFVLVISFCKDTAVFEHSARWGWSIAYVVVGGRD